MVLWIPYLQQEESLLSESTNRLGIQAQTGTIVETDGSVYAGILAASQASSVLPSSVITFVLNDCKAGDPSGKLL